MQPYEIATLSLFAAYSAMQALRALLAPGKYKEAELRFYKTGKPDLFDAAVFVLTGAALVALILHFTAERARLGQLLLYVQVILFAATLPLNFMPFLRERTKSTLNRKSTADYKSSGLKKLVLIAITVLAPFIFTR